MSASLPIRAAAGLRLARAGLFAAVCVAVTALGHAGASGAGIPTGTLLMGWLAVFGVAAFLAGRQRGATGMAGLLSVGQVGLHVLFCLGQGRQSMPTAAAHGGVGLTTAARLLCGWHGRALDPATATRLLTQAGLTPSGASGAPAAMPHGMSGALAMAMSPRMLAAHLAVGCLLGWLLARGERALWHTLALPAAALRRPFGQYAVLLRYRSVLAHRLLAACGLTSRADTDAYATRRARPQRFLRHCVARRGPPPGAWQTGSFPRALEGVTAAG